MNALADAAEHEAPARLGRYDLGRELGSGGMGTVVCATHRALAKRVAIKRFHPHLAARPESLARFVREGRAIAQLRHPHVVEVFDLDHSEEGAPYLVMELLEGSTLAEHLARSGPLSLADAVALFLPLASALGAAHAAGIVHRDVKPSNVFLRGGCLRDPCLVDFGVSKHAGPVALDELTESGTIVGSYPYFSPEHTRGAKHVTAQSDVYSLAAVLYECCTGRRPFDGDSAYALMHTIATQDPKRPSLARPDLPRELDDVIARAMARDPAERYPTMRAFGAALLGFADNRAWHVWSPELLGGPERRSLEATAVEMAPEASIARARPRPTRARRVLAPALLAGLLLSVALVYARHAPSPPRASEPVVAAAPDPAPAGLARDEAPSPEPTAAPPVPATAPPVVAAPRPHAAPARRSARSSPASEGTAPPQAERGSNGVPILD